MTARDVARIAVVAIATVGTAWFATLFTAAMAIAPADPGSAAALWPVDGALAGEAAAMVAGDPSRRRAEAAIALGSWVLAREPVNAEAARAIAVGELALGDLGRARAIITLGEALSRRDPATQTWLIEDRVQAGDIAGALVHYDRALRTHPETATVLLPVLASAANDPAIARALAARLAARPQWWSDFLGRFVATATSPSAMRLVADGLRLSPASEIDRPRIASILARMVALGAVEDARSLHAHVTGRRSLGVEDGGFEHDGGLPPFDWQLVDETDRSAVREPRDGAHGSALSLSGTEGKEVARQLLTLPPGRYRLGARIAQVAGGGLSPPGVALACVSGTGQPPFAVGSFTSGRAPHDWAMLFTVPPGCRGQWLIVGSSSGIALSGEQPWMDDVTIGRAGPATAVRRGPVAGG